jgi:hypothetical protein
MEQTKSANAGVFARVRLESGRMMSRYASARVVSDGLARWAPSAALSGPWSPRSSFFIPRPQGRLEFSRNMEKIIAIRDWFPLCTFCSFFFLDCNAHVIIQYIGEINVGHESREISWSCAMTNTMMIDCLHSSQRAVHGTRRLANLKVRERHSPLHASRGSGRTEAPFGRRGTLATRNHHVRSRLPRRCANRLRSLPPRSQAH